MSTPFLANAKPLHRRLYPVLRRAWFYSPERKEALRGALVSPGIYRCVICRNGFPKEFIDIDHRDPIGPIPGSKNALPGATWDEYIRRMFCSSGYLRALCKDCHKELRVKKA